MLVVTFASLDLPCCQLNTIGPFCVILVNGCHELFFYFFGGFVLQVVARRCILYHVREWGGYCYMCDTHNSPSGGCFDKIFGCVDTFTAERYSPHQIKRHKSKVQAPAPWGTSRSVKGLSHTAPNKFIFLFFFGGGPHTHTHTHTGTWHGSFIIFLNKFIGFALLQV
jgi:hypothetical protein